MEPINVNPEVRARIVSAIEELYDQLGRSDQFPTQAEVRAKAKADMNICSIVYREWKRQQTARPALVTVEVPELVNQAHREAVGIVWSAAQEQANAHLRDAEAKWELERSDNETMRRELAEAYEGAVAAADEAREALAVAQREKEQLAQQNQSLLQQLAEARENLVQQSTRAEENERRANDLKVELGLAHSEAANVRQELSQARVAHASEMEQQKTTAASQIELLSENLATAKARLDSANEQSEQRQTALSDAQAKLAQALAQAEAAAGELQRMRGALEAKQQQAEDLQLQVATVSAQLAELQRSHASLKDEATQSRHLAEESSREAAKVSGVLQEVQRQNADLMERLTHGKGKPTKKGDE
ncbi:DNA-binding protein [Pseudomonas aeruginosa]|uniref:DNA-binding protein n=1 Tax=Pseudomonas aeruginosa TaxID=287 RepID=UPI00155E15DE|nr:DNA-binding protein [Pseudomonas aeruginosa]EIU2701932.1 DNA-binding protein [Pseudomonas aeruginosa]NRC34161.1 hypothetical protein [Pseudomonas aeruginosa]